MQPKQAATIQLSRSGPGAVLVAMILMDGSATEHCVVSQGTVLYRRSRAVAAELLDK